MPTATATGVPVPSGSAVAPVGSGSVAPAPSSGTTGTPAKPSPFVGAAVGKSSGIAGAMLAGGMVTWLLYL